MIAPLRRYWAAHFTENPLLRREAGLQADQTRWRSPLLWVFILVACTLAMEVVILSMRWHGYAPLTADPPGGFYDSRYDFNVVHPPLLFEVRGLLSRIVLYLPAWLAAVAWGRDHSAAIRTQIAVSPLTVRQLIGAKSLLWLSAPLIIGVGWYVVHALYYVSAFLWAPDGSFLQALCTIQTLTEQLVGEGLFLPFTCLAPIAGGIFAVGLATRITLLCFKPLVAIVLVPLIITGVTRGAWWFWRWVIWPSLSVDTWVSSPWASLIYGSDFELYVFTLLAIVVFWRLPRHVAKAYGMNP